MKKIDNDILHLAVPSIITNITVPLLGMIDVAITGHMGSESFIGAIAVGGMLFNIIYWLFGFLRMGTSGMTAQGRGARRFDKVLTLLRQSLTVAVTIAVVLMLMQWPIRELSLWIIHPTEEVASLTRTYFNICIWGAIPSLSLFALMGWFIGMQNTRIPMFISILQNILNIACSLLFVFVFGMKIEGVALGTVIAQWIGLFVTLLLLKHYYLSRLRHYKATGSDVSYKRFFRVNRDIFLRTCCLVAVHFYFIAAGAKYGTICLAVNTILMQIFTLYSYFLDGFAFAGEALAGKAIGGGSNKQLQQVIRHLFLWGAAMTLIFSAVYAGWGRGLLSLFTDSREVLFAASDYVAWTLLFPICGAAAFIWDGIYCGATATRGMLISVFVSMAVFFMIQQMLAPNLGNHALWLAFIVYLLLRGVLQTLLWRNYYNEKNNS